MTRLIFLFPLCVALAGCDRLSALRGAPDPAPDPVVEVAESDAPLRPVLRPAVVPSDAPVAPAQQVGVLGVTIASLGSPADPGLWLKTPLVTRETRGRVVTASGGQLAVTLRPIAGEATAGSRLSLEAMQALGLPLAELVELTVIAD